MLTSVFSDASTSLSQGLAELATKAAIKRMSDEAAARAKAQMQSSGPHDLILAQSVSGYRSKANINRRMAG